jgi:phosphomannomutase
MCGRIPDVLTWSPIAMTRIPRVVAFDLDDTLAPSKSRIEAPMPDLLGRLLGHRDVCIISGGRFEQFDGQVLRHLSLPGPAALDRLHIMPTCGTRYYRWAGDRWRLIYSEDLSGADKDRILAALTDAARRLGLWEPRPWGEIIEDRGSQITFSALGQQAPVEAKYAWDPDGSRKRKLREHVAAQIPDLEVRVGGSTSIDVTRKGIDKAYGIGKLMEHLQITAGDVLFIGDRLDEGGNDYPVRSLGVRCVPVSRWQETAGYIEGLLAELS